MQYVSITENTTLKSLASQIGNRFVEQVLSVNGLKRSPNIGKQFVEKCNFARLYEPAVSWQRKSAILNRMSTDSDVFEQAALLNESDWKVLSSLNTFPQYLKIPDSIKLPDSSSILGDGVKVSSEIHDLVLRSLKDNHRIDPSIFNRYDYTPRISTLEYSKGVSTWQDFRIPWGEVTLYSSLDDSSVDFPVYPEEISDGRSANYTTMPDLLYQYEPWQVYQSSGPRSNQYVFKFHRDMWTGDHRDGQANQMIRFCEACCYPEYKGSAVHLSTVTLYIGGSPKITGVLTNVETSWSGPLGLDNFYLYCEMTLTIVEVSKKALNYNEIKSLPLKE